jgi:phage protein D
MDLATISSSRGAFYVPAFSVRVAGADIVREHLIAVSQVEADLVLGAAGRFSFTVVDAYSIERHAFISGNGRGVLELLTFGAAVEICMGYASAGALKVIMTGVITEISTSFPESGYPELSIAGYDRAFSLTVGKNSETWTKSSDSDAVAKIARFHNLTGDIETTREKHAQIEQNQESDLEFIKKLAQRNHFEFYVYKDTLRFGKPRDKGDGVVRLRWGEGLLSFKPEANLAGQVTAVEVHGWDPGTKQAIVGRATAGSESGRDPRALSAANLLQKPGYQQPVLRLRQPVFTQAEADSRALAVLNERAKQFLTGDAESIGLPEIRPDVSVTLENLGSPFSKTYYVEQATHKVDSNGYRTRFKVKETTW